MQKLATPLRPENPPIPNSELAYSNSILFRHIAQQWLSMQSAYDLRQAEHREQPVIERFARIVISVGAGLPAMAVGQLAYA
ncbi:MULTISPECIES: hypothetical protein [unclassified Pseudomonas]|uniref:hypothetical protein n=1 Tax=unclassified Pseudomonas TaxID=196821 RepID=UPI0030DCD9DD